MNTVIKLFKLMNFCRWRLREVKNKHGQFDIFKCKWWIPISVISCFFFINRFTSYLILNSLDTIINRTLSLFLSSTFHSSELSVTGQNMADFYFWWRWTCVCASCTLLWCPIVLTHYVACFHGWGHLIDSTTLFRLRKIDKCQK